MVKPSLRLLRSLHPHPVSNTQASPLIYSLGLSYASKSSPPFVPASSKPLLTGFAGQPTKLGRWVDEMLSLRAGRGELRGGIEGGWDEGLGEETRKWGAGEDFFALVDGVGWTHLALADGVGGWAPQYDPSLFSQSLLYHYSSSASSSPSSHPSKHLQAGYDSTLSDPSVPAGSSTAVAISLSGNGDLRGVNLGDSGLTILRQGRALFTSEVQTHYFNCPLQLSKIPNERSEGVITDTPSQADLIKFDLQPGDAVILYTDGLSDNLPSPHLPLLSSAIDKVLSAPNNAHLSPDDKAAERARLLADVLVGYGRMAMGRTGEEDGGRGWKTPFEVEAKRNGYNYKGGKVDDITVITAVVSERI